MNTAVVTARVPQGAKDSARDNLERLGLSVSDYLRTALEFMSNSESLPKEFELIVTREHANSRLLAFEQLMDIADGASYRGSSVPALGQTHEGEDAEVERVLLERLDG